MDRTVDRMTPRIAERLNTIRILEWNWNGYGALPISTETADRAVAFINALPAERQPSYVVPTSDGGVQLEWETKDGKYLEIEVLPENFGYFLLLPNVEKEAENVDQATVLGALQRYQEAV